MDLGAGDGVLPHHIRSPNSLVLENVSGPGRGYKSDRPVTEKMTGA